MMDLAKTSILSTFQVTLGVGDIARYGPIRISGVALSFLFYVLLMGITTITTKYLSAPLAVGAKYLVNII